MSLAELKNDESLVTYFAEFDSVTKKKKHGFNKITPIGDEGSGKSFARERVKRGLGKEIGSLKSTKYHKDGKMMIEQYFLDPSKTLNLEFTVPLEGYKDCKIFVKKPKLDMNTGEIKKDEFDIFGIEAKLTDIPGQHRTEDDFDELRTSKDYVKNSAVVELFIDCERPKSLDSLIDVWFPNFIEDKVINRTLKDTVFNIYFSKAATTESKLDYKSLTRSVKDKYEIIKENFPRINELLDKFKDMGLKTMVSVGDNDLEINGKQNQAESYILRTDDWLTYAVKMENGGTKYIPFMKALHHKDQLSDGSIELINHIERSYGKIITY